MLNKNLKNKDLERINDLIITSQDTYSHIRQYEMNKVGDRFDNAERYIKEIRLGLLDYGDYDENKNNIQELKVSMSIHDMLATLYEKKIRTNDENMIIEKLKELYNLIFGTEDILKYRTLSGTEMEGCDDDDCILCVTKKTK